MELAAILEQYHDAFMARYATSLSSTQRQAIGAIRRCRTPAAGQWCVRCTGCARCQYQPLSCGHRQCPKCQNHTATQWLERQRAKLLPVDYFMVTFTLPAELRDLAWRYPSALYAMLFACASSTLKDFGLNPQYLGAGADYLYDVVVYEEMARGGFTGPGFMIHTDLVATYLRSFGSEAQKRHWLPKMVTGEAIGALGMTEPHAGSDLKNIRTRASRDGDAYVINGQLCDLLVLATKTDGTAGAKGITLFLVEGDRPGFKRGRNLNKLGLKAQDTSELFFEDVRVPASSMLGGEGMGFGLMMTKLSQERLAQAIRSAAVTEAVIEWTVEYTAQREAFGQTIADFQNTQFKLAELKTEAVAGRVLTDRCIELFMQDALDPIDAAMAKMFLSNLHCKTMDECLQLFGGWGYM